MTSREFEVPNISCGHCAHTIEREVRGIPGVSSVSADAVERTVAVEWDEAATDWSAIRNRLEEIHYPPAGV